METLTMDILQSAKTTSSTQVLIFRFTAKNLITVYDWNYDYANNKFLIQKNDNDTKNMNTVYDKIRTDPKLKRDNMAMNFFNYQNKFYIYAYTEGYRMMTSSDDEEEHDEDKLYYNIIEPINDSYIIKYTNYYLEKYCMFFDSEDKEYHVSSDLLQITEKKYITNPLNFQDKNKCPAVNDLYYIISNEVLESCTIDSSLQINAIKKINLNGKVKMSVFLENRIFMIINNNLVIYDIIKNSLEIEYSYGSISKIEKYGKILVLRQFDETKYYIFTLKAPIMKIKYFDLFFQFA